MCRHLAYLGPATTLRSVIIEPSHGLYRQGWAPRLQRHWKTWTRPSHLFWQRCRTRTASGDSGQSAG